MISAGRFTSGTTRLFNLVSRDEHMRIATLSVSPVTEDDRKRWRNSLERLGPEEVRRRLGLTTTFDPDEAVDIDDQPPWATRSVVEAWLDEKRAEADRRENSRYRTIKWWTIIGAIAAIVAAIAGVVALLR